MTTKKPSSRGTRLPADERRAAIVEAAMTEFAAGGLAGTSTEAIARRAGVSQPYVFQLFGTKRALFLAAVQRGFERTRATFEQAARRHNETPDPDCPDVLTALGKAYMRLLADRTLLLVQLHAYAACADPEVRTAVRAEYAATIAAVRDLAGDATAENLRTFFASGMLLNVAAALGLEGTPESWSLDAIGGGV